MKKEALYYQKLKNKLVQCNLCPKNCFIKPGEYGNCRARKNINGKLFSFVYGSPCSIAVDPIEKKPLYHFMPGEKAFSIGTFCCNLQCDFCQNWEISQQQAIENKNPILPKEIVSQALKSKCKIIAYTYNEPTIFYEYVLETARLAKKKGIKNVLVSNGFINEKPLRELLSYIDAANIDLKSFDDNFYKKICKASLEPVLKSLKIIKEANVHLEITNLIIPTLNDKLELIDKMCRWISENLGNNIPLHFSAFYPCYKMANIQPTPKEILQEAKKIAEKNNLNYIYIGNVPSDSSTYCPKCKNILIERSYYTLLRNNIENNRCSLCKSSIYGIWT